MNDIDWIQKIPLAEKSYIKGWNDFINNIDKNPYNKGSNDYQLWCNGRFESRIKCDEEKCKKKYEEWVEFYKR